MIKAVLHYLFVIFTLLFMMIMIIPAIFFWLFGRFNIIGSIYWWAGDIERKYFNLK